MQQVENRENERLCTQARINWQLDGERNSKLFHASIKARRKCQAIQITEDDGQTTTDPKEIANIVEPYFSHLFSSSTYVLDERLFNCIVPTVSANVNLDLCAIPTTEEIWNVVKQINPNRDAAVIYQSHILEMQIPFDKEFSPNN